MSLISLRWDEEGERTFGYPVVSTARSRDEPQRSKVTRREGRCLWSEQRTDVALDELHSALTCY